MVTSAAAESTAQLRSEVVESTCWLPELIEPGDAIALFGRFDAALVVVDRHQLTVLATARLLEMFDAKVPLSAVVGRELSQWSHLPPFDQAAGVWKNRNSGLRRVVRLAEGKALRAEWTPLRLADRTEVDVLLLRDVTAQAGVQQQLRAHNRALAELVATKTEQVTAMLHRVRTPLTSLSAAVQLLSDDYGDDPITDVVYRAAERLRQVVDDIAMLSALENGITPVAHDRIDVPKLVTEAASRWQQQLPSYTRLDFTVTDGDELNGDTELLTALLDRMIAAAAATADTDTVISLTAEAHADYWSIQLSLPAQVSSDRLFTTIGDTDAAAALAYARAILWRHSGSLHIITEDSQTQLQAKLPLHAEPLLG